MAACVRRVWLTLDTLSVDLHNEAAGYFCTEFDLGSVDVREVVNGRPDADGLDDRTLLLGGRVISANVTALAGAGAVLDDVADSFGPFMHPSYRPTLHYVLDRAGTPERTLVVRGQSYDYKVNDAWQRDIGLTFLAADPIAYDPVAKTGTATAGASTLDGRAYSWSPAKTYPGTDATAGVAAVVTTAGDVPVRPVLRFNGPNTAAQSSFTNNATGALLGRVTFTGALVIDVGRYVIVDCNARTAYRDGDPSQDVTALLNWSAIQNGGGWPRIPPRTSVRFGCSGSTTTAATNVVATWNDGYLS